MYYIINQNEQIVAIDPKLLLELSVKDTDTFYKKVALDEIVFHLSEDTVTISINGETMHFDVLVTPLTGMLGDIKIVDLDAPTVIPQDKEKEEETMIDFDALELFDEKKIETPETEIIVEEAPTAERESEETEELFELILPTDSDNAIAEVESIELFAEDNEDLSCSKEQNTPIYINIVHNSETIGIMPEDYTRFLDEYIDTALAFEKTLQSTDETERNEAIDTLSHLSSVLQLPFIGDILTQIKEASETECDNAIESFFATLGRLSTAHFDKQLQNSTTEANKIHIKETRHDDKSTLSIQKRTAIDLSNVKPIHFDFQLEEAANDLSLPVELIEEFVCDFIAQAHEETKKMLAAYENGDLETVQKIGHLLKGTSSNLRIMPLSDTLYKIQFNEDIERVPELIKNYWGHFLSLENQIKLISNT